MIHGCHEMLQTPVRMLGGLLEANPKITYYSEPEKHSVRLFVIVVVIGKITAIHLEDFIGELPPL